MSSPLYLAIDHPHLDAAVTLAQKVRHHVGG
ncbi:MAG: orotidine-5'-phosphate decarboxylase, partial [Sphingopyxis sp.]|nr:orotidine-5'-phosphate decarboxylase [Sphingopyxis sp.]